MSDAADDAIDELYAGDLDDFVARRDRLAKELRTAGDRDAAAAVKQLRKPSRAAWAVNQAVRRAPDKFDAVLQAGGALRDVQQRAIREGGGVGLHDAVRARQRAVGTLADVGVAALGSTGENAREAIEQTLQAASIDDDAAAAVREARLVQELEPPDIFASLQPGPARPVARSTTAAPARREKAAPAEKKDAVQKERPRAAADRRALEQAGEAETAATAARRDADTAQREHEAAKARADELTEAARDAAAAADEARAAARDAGARARDARKTAERAEQAARRARAAAPDA